MYISGYELDLGPRYQDLDGEPVKHTPWTHPYNYDDFVQWKCSGFKKDDYPKAVYSDRLMSWDYEKFSRCVQEVWNGHGQCFNNRKPEDIQRFLSLYYDKPIQLGAVMQGCNQGNGQPLWIFFYRVDVVQQEDCTSCSSDLTEVNDEEVSDEFENRAKKIADTYDISIKQAKCWLVNYTYRQSSICQHHCINVERCRNIHEPKEETINMRNTAMKDLANWTELMKGIYRYVLAANACYEIHVIKHPASVQVKDATADLYLVGDWYNIEGDNEFTRECLVSNSTVAKCLAVAHQDYLSNF